MKRKLIIGFAVAFVVGAAIATAKNRSTGPRPTMFEKMQEHMEAMPADFPPRVMFDNVEATRANSERILELLEQQAAGDFASPDDIEVVQTT